MRSSKRNSTAAPPPAPVRRSAATLLAAALAGLLAGCGAEPPPEAASRDVVRPALGFAIDVPEGWTWTDLPGDIFLEILPRRSDTASAESAAPDEGKPEADAGDASDTADAAERRHRARTGPVVHVAVVDHDGMTLDAWADQTIAAAKELQSDLEVVSRGPARTAAGREALTLVLKNPRGLEPFVQRLRLVLTETRAYALLATAPESEWPAAETAIETCIDSFVVW